MTDAHNLYTTESFALGGTPFPGFTTIEHSETRSQVVPKGDRKLRRQRGYTTMIEEKLTVECEDIGTALPVGPVAMAAVNCRSAIGDTFGPTLTIQTKAAVPEVTGPPLVPAVPAGTVEIVGVTRNINGESSGRMRLEIAVNSPDGFASGIEFESEAP